MQAPLTEIVYCSRATSFVGDPTGTEIAEILATSRRNNEHTGITGALLFSAGCFAQILEGPTEAVERVFARIHNDPRHQGVVVLSRGGTVLRAFPDWAMGLVTAQDELAAEATLTLALASGGATADQVRGMLRSSIASTAIWGQPTDSAAN